MGATVISPTCRRGDAALNGEAEDATKQGAEEAVNDAFKEA